MAHELHKDANGKASFAYVGDETWHGLGQKLSPNSPIPVWIEEAGFNFDIKDTAVCGVDEYNGIIEFPEKRMLYRSDTRAPLAVVGNKYKVVQPKEVLQFYEDLVETGGFHLETAGVMFGGKRFFALAKTNEAEEVVKGDKVAGYLLLATACDGTMATTATPTSVRVVCQNTMKMALAEKNQKMIKVPHSTTFNASEVKTQLGLAQSAFDNFMVDMRMLAGRKLNKREEVEFLIDLFGDNSKTLEDQLPGPAKLMKDVHKLYSGAGMGADLVRGTAWGMLNAVTEYADHHTGHKTQDARMDSAWFGANANLKEQARDLLHVMAL